MRRIRLFERTRRHETCQTHWRRLGSHQQGKWKKEDKFQTGALSIESAGVLIGRRTRRRTRRRHHSNTGVDASWKRVLNHSESKEKMREPGRKRERERERERERRNQKKLFNTIKYIEEIIKERNRINCYRIITYKLKSRRGIIQSSTILQVRVVKDVYWIVD